MRVRGRRLVPLLMLGDADSPYPSLRGSFNSNTDYFWDKVWIER